MVLFGSKQLLSANKHNTIKGTIIIVTNRKKKSDTLYYIRQPILIAMAMCHLEWPYKHRKLF